MKALQKRDHQLLNGLKIQLQPIMDQINRRYKKFRQPVIAQSQIDYLFAESDPSLVQADVAGVITRPYEIVKDKFDRDVLRDTLTGKTYHNLETTTIEERLSNGFYARPKDFLFDIKALARDAKNIGDKERTLKANELLSNVEVDVASIENNTTSVDWEGLYRRQLQRATEAAEKERKRKAMQSRVDKVQSDLGGGNDSDSQGPVTLGEQVPGTRTTMARFQVRSPLSNGHGQSSVDLSSLSNGASHVHEGPDVQMSGIDDDTQNLTQLSAMGPPSQKAAPGATQISQKSAVTALPPGMSPSAVINEASTTKTSDPSTNRSSNWGTDATNGVHEEQSSGSNNNDTQNIPDTLPLNAHYASPFNAHYTSSDEQWPHSQFQAMARGVAANISSSESPASSQAPGTQVSRGGPAKPLKTMLNAPAEDEHQSIRQSGSSGSQPLSVEAAIENFLLEVVNSTGGCTIEQLEQLNREMMDVIWQTRHEWNRTKVLQTVTSVFNDTIGDIEIMQAMGPLSQE